MTIADLRSLASYHQRKADTTRAAVLNPVSYTEAKRLQNLAAWHKDAAKKLTELADTFEAAGKLLTNITGNYP